MAKAMATGNPLFVLARQTLEALRAELATHHVQLEPGLAIQPGEGLLCYYHRGERQIYLSAPDPAQPRGRFELLIFQHLMQFRSACAVLELLEQITPWLVAHEVGHHLRRQMGLWGEDAGREEQIASELATAFVKSRLSDEQRQALLTSLAAGLAGLGQGLAYEQTRRDAPSLIRHVYEHMRQFHAQLESDDPHTIAAFVHTHLLCAPVNPCA